MNAAGATTPEVDLFPRGGTTAATVLIAALAGIGGGLLANDTGTRVGHRADMRSIAGGTRLVSYTPDSPVQPFVQPTRTERILTLTGLSQRQLADVLNVSHTMVSKWIRTEPNRAQLTQILVVVEDARRYHPDLTQWLTAPLPGTGITPLTLMKAENWRALRGAVRAKPSPSPRLSRDELLARRHGEVSWALAEPAIPSVVG